MASGNINGLTENLPYLVFNTIQGQNIEIWKDHTAWWNFRFGDIQTYLKHLPINDGGLSYYIHWFAGHYGLDLIDENYTIACIEKYNNIKINEV